MRLEGRQIGRYHFERLIGAGGMGEVYLAVDPRIQQQVAIKVVQAEGTTFADANTDQNMARFRQEASAIANLNHPHIVHLNDYDEVNVDGTALTYLVTPFYKDGSLANWLRARTFSALSLQDIEHIVRQVADALQYAHNHQIIHRDVKPSNFLIDKEESVNRPNLLLTDFGISTINNATTYSGAPGSLGTIAYMAPEQMNGQPTYASDQYALAAMTYELLTGHPPFQGPPQVVINQHFNAQPQPPSSLKPTIPQAIDSVILRALAKTPEDRFDSIAAFANAFQQALQRSDASSKPPPPVSNQTRVGVPPVQPGGYVAPSPPARKSNQALWITLGVVGGLLLLSCIIYSVIYATLPRRSGSTSSSTSTPIQTLTNYCNALKSSDYPTAYNLWASSARGQLTESQFQSEREPGINQARGISRCAASIVSENSSNASGTITYIFNNGQSGTANYTLINENGLWVISQSDSI